MTTTTTLTAPPPAQDVLGTGQALGTTGQQHTRPRASTPPGEELDAVRGLIDGLLLALPFWLIVALLLAAL